MKSKKGQMKISFGMIFSIILIVVFLGFGFYVIRNAISFGNQVQIDKFYKSFGNDVTNAWGSTQASTRVSYTLPGYVQKVCFRNDPNHNVYLEGKSYIHDNYIEHLNITKDFCVGTSNGDVNFTIVKNYGEPLVQISN